MKTYTIREYRKGEIVAEFKPYKRKSTALSMAKIVKNNEMIDKVDVLVKEYGEYEKAGEYKETIINV
jgi:hypothetical protein